MWRHFIQTHHLPVSAVRDYSLAGTLTASPLWVQYLTDFGTPVLTFVCVATGAVVGVKRVWLGFSSKPDGKEK